MTFRAVLLSGAVLAAATSAAAAQTPDLRVFREEALAHALALENAFRSLEEHILARSAAATAWTGSTPPASVGWRDAWTARGLRARYCGDVLLVYYEPARLKGVGIDHGAVRAAPWTYAPRTQRAPALHRLDGGVARGGVGRSDTALPACLSGAAFGGALPSGRAARAGRVLDPFVHTRTRATFETRVQPCPAGFHASHAAGAGRTVGRSQIREVRQTVTRRGADVGGPIRGAWRTVADNCRADYAVEETGTQACPAPAGWQGGEAELPQRIRRRTGTVTASGTAWGAWRTVEDNCWVAVAAADPSATVTVRAGARETRTIPCPPGWPGTPGQETRTGPGSRKIEYSFGGSSTATITAAPWVTTHAANCSPPPASPGGSGGASSGSGPMGGPGGVDAGYDYDTGGSNADDGYDAGDDGGGSAEDSGDDAGMGGEDV